MITSWDSLPLRLDMAHVAELLDVNVSTVRKRVLAASPLVPPPAFLRPYGWRKSDVREWFERETVTHQRHALAREARGAI